MSRFNFKTFTSFLLVLTFLTLTLSGVMLFLSPPGRVAHWTNWTLVGLGKEEWGALHILMAIVFLVGSLFHLLKFNWKIFFHYLKRKRHGTQHRLEMFASIALFVLVLVGTLEQIPPFTSVIAFHEEIKGYWENESGSPPVPHMELMNINEIASSVGVSSREVIEKLNRQGFSVSSEDQTLQSIAAAGGLSPRDLYALLQQGDGSGPTGSVIGGSLSPGRGLGRRTLAEIAKELEISTERVEQILQSRGLEANPDETLREIAERNAVGPHELLEILRGAQSE
jgi:hypothetical protein